MIAAAVLALALGEQASSPSLVSQIAPRSDPTNGYVDYLRAADLATTGGADPYVNYGVEGSRAIAALQGLDFLGVQQASAEKFSGVYDYVREGNTKRAWDPRPEVNTKTTFPEFKTFPTVSKLLCSAAYASLANDKPKEGFSQLLDALTFARHSYGSAVIGALVSDLDQSRAFEAFAAHLGQMDEKDAKRIADYADRALKEPVGLRQVAIGARSASESAVQSLIESAAIGAGEPTGEPAVDRALGFLRRATPAERDQAVASTIRTLDGCYGKLDAALAGDESAWIPAADDTPPPIPSEIASVQDASDVLAGTVWHSLDRVVRHETIVRTEMRLLLLHARVIDYRWRNNRLPASLTDAATASEIRDPLCGEPFKYEVRDGEFLLSSKGSQETGPITLGSPGELAGGASGRVLPPNEESRARPLS